MAGVVWSIRRTQPARTSASDPACMTTWRGAPIACLLADVNIDEDECTEQDWFIFPAGRDREEIRHWFDRNYSGGVDRKQH